MVSRKTRPIRRPVNVRHIAALDHARIPGGPGGPAAMVPGQHHVRMSMYIGQARGGRFEIVENLGAMDPQERLVDTRVLTA
jgi:hypothetical protein